MATSEMDYMNVGGDSNVKAQAGIFTVTDETEVTIDVGFEPSRVVAYKLSGATADWSSGDVLILYDKNLSSSYQFRAYKTSSPYLNRIDAPPNTSNNNCISEITSNGFKYKSTSTTGFQGTFYYMAFE